MPFENTRLHRIRQFIQETESSSSFKALEAIAQESSVSTSSPSQSPPRTPSIHSSTSSSASRVEIMALEQNVRERTLKELAAPNIISQPLCINFPNVQQQFELKSGLIRLLPIFRGLAGEDPNKHLKEFDMICSSMKPPGVTEDQIKLRAFPFSLGDLAKDWLYYIPSGSVTTWDEMARLFLEKYFPASKAASIRKEICGIRQNQGETLYEYWERFKRLCASCPHHQISEQLLIQYFYEGLLPMERSMIDAASGGALVDKTPNEARALISNMAANTQQFGTRTNNSARNVSEVSTQSLQNQISDLTSLVRQIAVGNMQVKVCGICSAQGHMTDMCPTLQEDYSENVNAIGGFPGQPQRKYDPFSNTYNPGWRDHPNFSYGNQGGRNFNFQQGNLSTSQYQPKTQVSRESGNSLEDIVKMLATNQVKFQQENDARFINLERQIGQIATSLSKLESQGSGKLPSQTVINPKEGVNAVTLTYSRKGKEIDQPDASKAELEHEKVVEPETLPQTKTDKVVPNSVNSGFKILPPFPGRFARSKKEELEKDILDTFRKVQVNIPLLDAIKQVPKYAKFLKEMCTTKRRYKVNEKVSLGENVSAVIQRKLPPKCKDPGSFTIPCRIGNTSFERVMCDLGSSINVMPRSIFNKLNLGNLKETGVIIQLADRSNVYPDGVVEDILVQVNNLVFPADFYILDMKDEFSINSAPILLGRPFMKTAKTKIDVHSGTLTMEFDGEVISFSIFDAMKYPSEVHNVFHVDIIDSLVQDIFNLGGDDEFHLAISQGLEKDNFEKMTQKATLENDTRTIHSLTPLSKKFNVSFIELPITYNKLLPSVLQAPKVELKQLPEQLKYAFLGGGETLPVIIAKDLTSLQEERLIRVLKERKSAIGWTIADIKGISPSTCMHRILLEEGAKPSREAQRRLNPPMKEVVMKEILKLLDAGVIYPISDSKWVSPIHVVPKKSGITVVTNQDRELIPTQV